MKFSKSLLASTALLASMSVSAGAQVTGSLGGPSGTPIMFSAPASCNALAAPLNNCSVGGFTINGGAIRNIDNTAGDNTAFGGGPYLAAGFTVGQPATITFNQPVLYVSFLWGSPDAFNVLTVNTTSASQSFNASAFNAITNPGGLGLASTNGNQTVAQYVQFQANPGQFITSMVFNNSPVQNDAFEATNFHVRTVPEPASYALLATGLLAFGFMSNRRKRA